MIKLAILIFLLGFLFAGNALANGLTIDKLPPNLSNHIFSYIPGSKPDLTLVSKYINSLIQEENCLAIQRAIARGHSEARRSVRARSRWADSPTLDIKAYLHDRNFWRGFLIFLRAANLWNTDNGLQPLENPNRPIIHRLRSQLEFYLVRLQPRSLAHKILKCASQFLQTGQPSVMRGIFNSPELLRQANNNNSSAQDVLSFCYLHGIGVRKNIELAKKYAYQAAEDTLPLHPGSRYSYSKIRYLELRADIKEIPFNSEYFPDYRKIVKNIFTSIKVKRNLRDQARAKQEEAEAKQDIATAKLYSDHEIYFAEQLFPPRTEWLSKLIVNGNNSDRRALAFAYFRGKQYDVASRLYDQLATYHIRGLAEALELDDKRKAAYAHFYNGNYETSEDYIKQVLTDPSATEKDRQFAAQVRKR